MAGKGVRQAEHRGQLRAEQAGAKNIERHVRACARRGADAGPAVIGKIALQLHHIAREGIGIAVQIATHRGGHALVGARGAAQPQINSAGEQRIERAELFGDHDRRMIGQHDAAGTDANRAGGPGHMGQHDAGRRAGNAFHTVMFGGPVPVEAQAFGMPRQIGCVGQRLGYGAAVGDGDEIEQG